MSLSISCTSTSFLSYIFVWNQDSDTWSRKIAPYLWVLVAWFGFSLSAFGYDIDVTFIDRLPNYAFDASKNKPQNGDSVTFVGHIKLDHTSAMEVPYKWLLDGIELSSGTKNLLPNTDNTLSVPWTWDSERHEIMLAVNLSGADSEASNQNNILFDFTDALIVGVAVENGLVNAFPAFQRPLNIGSQGFEDWFQRMIRIWNLALMEPASNLASVKTVEIRDRVRGVLSYHTDGSLSGGNCPVQWKEVDMLWGKLATDSTWYEDQKSFWFYEWALPHELTHARYLPDTYTFDMAGNGVEVIDDSGQLVRETDYMPQNHFGVVYYNNGANGNMGAGGLRYSLFSGYLFNRVAGQRALGCNTNGCCGHNTNWRDELPANMQLLIRDLNGDPRAGVQLQVYTRVGAYWPYVIDNEVDFSMVTDSDGRATLPIAVFDDIGLFILKIVSADGTMREYRFVERTGFHIAYWSGSTDSFDYEIRTDFDLPPTATNILNRSAARGETFEITFQGTGFSEGQSFIYGDSDAIIHNVTLVSPNETRVTMTQSRDIIDSQPFRVFNSDGKYARIINPYQGSVALDIPDARPIARFLHYSPENGENLELYFNGLWSDDWSRLYNNDGNYPKPGTGPIVSYAWDFGDGETSSLPFVVHRFPRPGAYTVSLTVTDEDGLTDTFVEEIYVEPLEVDLISRDGFEFNPTSQNEFLQLVSEYGEGDTLDWLSEYGYLFLSAVSDLRTDGIPSVYATFGDGDGTAVFALNSELPFAPGISTSVIFNDGPDLLSLKRLVGIRVSPLFEITQLDAADVSHFMSGLALEPPPTAMTAKSTCGGTLTGSELLLSSGCVRPAHEFTCGEKFREWLGIAIPRVNEVVNNSTSCRQAQVHAIGCSALCLVSVGGGPAAAPACGACFAGLARTPYGASCTARIGEALSKLPKFGPSCKDECYAYGKCGDVVCQSTGPQDKAPCSYWGPRCKDETHVWSEIGNCMSTTSGTFDCCAKSVECGPGEVCNDNVGCVPSPGRVEFCNGRPDGPHTFYLEDGREIVVPSGECLSTAMDVPTMNMSIWECIINSDGSQDCGFENYTIEKGCTYEVVNDWPPGCCPMSVHKLGCVGS